MFARRMPKPIAPKPRMSIIQVPGSGTEIRDVRMDFDYTDAFDVTPPEAYERLLHDALRGDSTLFTRRDEVEVEWSIADPILNNWARDDSPPFRYPQGSWGPDEANDFMARDGRRWHLPLSGQRDNGNEKDGEA